ncbi:transporter substrate-binding domain-containing protein [Devosia algicola]|uniref:Transporter substrate-binding domain-containing protein n=1 Tax=Devosia algicola TaxID=3026418 RepID=A0ABY7YJW5_9HYPH|nr:transporter substrate-binding domain-containing protein [Devosia algicola]WDR01374.1 transporter substrate-binding domain-containing protein [Devosia algicola]
MAYTKAPFVMIDGDQVSGMAIDLWQSFAQNLNLEYDYKPFEKLSDLVDATAENQVNVAVTNLTVTEDRAARIDFTQPWFDAGLRIMVNEDQGPGLTGLWAGLRDSGYLQAYGWLALVIVLATVGFTFFDRRFDKNFTRHWPAGLAESFYTVMSIATSGRPPSRKNLFGWLGRFWQGIWLVCGIAVFAYVTSSITSVMTTLSLNNHIHSLDDLAGKTIGVAQGSTAQSFIQAANLTAVPFSGMTELAKALTDGKIDALIGDKPVLEYYAHIHPELPLSVVGSVFHPDKYAFALSPDTVLRKALTVEVVGAHEDGLLGDLNRKYFGE